MRHAKPRWQLEVSAQGAPPAYSNTPSRRRCVTSGRDVALSQNGYGRASCNFIMLVFVGQSILRILSVRFPFSAPPSLPPASPSSSSRSLSSFLVPARVFLFFLSPLSGAHRRQDRCAAASVFLSALSARAGTPLPLFFLRSFFLSLSLYFSLACRIALSIGLGENFGNHFLIVLLLMAIGVLDALFLQEFYIVLCMHF